MTWGYVAVGAGMVVGAYIGSKASKSAASTQAEAAARAGDTQYAGTLLAIEEEKRQYDLGRADFEKYFNIEREDRLTERAEERADVAPWRLAGKEALEDRIPGIIDMIMTGPGKFERDPGQEFIRSEGEKALNISAAAKGNLLSTNQVKNLMRFGQDRAATDYDTFLQRFRDKMALQLNPQLSLAQLGQVGSGPSAVTTGTPPSTNNIPNLLMQGAQGRANTLMNIGNISAINQMNQGQIWSSSINQGVNNYLAWKYYNPSTSTTPTPAPVPTYMQRGYGMGGMT